MRSYFLLAAVAAVLPFTPAQARITSGYTIRPTEIVSGPDDRYPIVRNLGPNVRVMIYGCLNDWSWCDVAYGYDRGWITRGDLVVFYQGRRRQIAPFLGIDVLTFMFGNYWDNHYRARPFYTQRSRWEQTYSSNIRPEWQGGRGHPREPLQRLPGPGMRPGGIERGGEHGNGYRQQEIPTDPSRQPAVIQKQPGQKQPGMMPHPMGQGPAQGMPMSHPMPNNGQGAPGPIPDEHHRPDRGDINH
ncbi:uncharacterized protein YraI [Novosphingobium sp. 1748]|uniref:SH3 domain-containing protein n=1 Tax=Novosphingobium sp. 1748 TaxID=2817760 RepID=UPI002860D471|nr:hypothetical protein [Novosphingobium sp. 1748]MDR6709267.1 uncharacterized protein YraI [Novosphingobium sp. 1748]